MLLAIHEVVNIVNFPLPLGPAVLNDIHEPLFSCSYALLCNCRPKKKSRSVFLPAVQQ